jgi:Rap1a immunity proteins
MDRVMRALLIAAAVVASFGAAAQERVAAFFNDGNELHEHCTSNRTRALPYIIGVYDTQAFFVATGVVSKHICISTGVAADQITEVACKSLADKPQNRHLGAAALVVYALAGAFPCRN